MKPGLKYYGFKKGNETGVKIFREKNPENLGMKTWIREIALDLSFFLRIMSKLQIIIVNPYQS